MGDYLLISRPSDNETARQLSIELARLAQENGLLVYDLTPKVWLGVCGPSPPRVRHIGGWALIGDVFDRRSPKLAPSSALDPWDYEQKLIARIWGRYVGVLFGADQQASALLRDPSGAMECVVWAQHGLTIVSSSAHEWLLQRLRPPWRLNMERLAQALHDPVAATGVLLLDGPIALEPGTLQPLPATRPPHLLWRPAAIAEASLGPAPSAEEASTQLRAAIDEAVMGLAGLSRPIAAEVSGGLDSSIVASSLMRSDADAVRLWINSYGSTPESDERGFARILGSALGFKPVCAPHATAVLTTTWLEGVSGGFRPGFNALDRPHGLDWARRMADAEVTAVMTGKGGDAILLQAATPEVFTDLWRVHGWRAMWSSDMAELAAANEVSLWTMLRLARRHGREGFHRPRREHPLLAPAPEKLDLHPWLRNCEGFGPAKAFQIAGVADNVSHHGPTALTASIDVRNPLCAQPVTEACLALPTPLLTFGGRDRGLARQAFRKHLPPEIIDRRTKGDMTRLYGRMVLDNLEFLRSWLIDGRLADFGIIDRGVAAVELDPETLIWRGRYGTIMAAAALEGWVRRWERRLGQAG